MIETGVPPMTRYWLKPCRICGKPLGAMEDWVLAIKMDKPVVSVEETRFDARLEARYEFAPVHRRCLDETDQPGRRTPSDGSTSSDRPSGTR